jgi:hypothetical protein
MTDIPTEAKLEAGAYEVIRKRLDAQGAELRSRLEKLNEDRKTIFGGIETNLLSTARLTTENNCVPRDMAGIGPKRFIFGYNVVLGLKSQLQPEDLFAIYDYDPRDHSFHLNKEGLLNDQAFQADFSYLFQYYKAASFLKFHRSVNSLYLVFQVGRDVTEVKAFKWRVDVDRGTMEYLGNRFDHEFTYPPTHEFEWKKVRHDSFRHGTHPHVSIEDKVFVETVGGDLTVKVEDNTTSGAGIYSEPVDNKDQILDDAEYHYAILGNLVLIKVLPYQEKTWRYLVFNERTQEVLRIDAIAESCVLLPDGQGILFPRGYVLQTGEVRQFDTGLPTMRFERKVTSANGEDTLYVFDHLETGTYLLLSYNLVEQQLATPIISHGFALFDNGELIVLNGENEPRKHHVVQAWQTPFLADQQAEGDHADSLLGKIGNAEAVSCIAECRGVLTLLGKDDSYSGLYVELVRLTGDITDSYFWLDKPEAHGLRETLLAIRGAAESALGEFEKVKRLRAAADAELARLREASLRAVREADNARHGEIQGFVSGLATLRELRGRVIAAREVRYIDEAGLTELDGQIAASMEGLGGRCTEFLLEPESLMPYERQIAEQQAQLAKVGKVTEADELDEALKATSADLELLITVVGSLTIRDATETTRITENISALFAKLNQARSMVKARRDELARGEGTAEFHAQLNLLKQAIVSQIELCDTPDKCDEAVTRMMVRIEELEGRFGEFEEFAEELILRREETQAAFDGRRQALVEARNRRGQALAQAADRVLTSVRNRLATFSTPEEVHSYLATDAMAVKARDLIEDLRTMGDSVRADEIATRFKTLREEAVKQIRDKAELFVDGGDLIQLGQHRFTVNRQPLELTLLMREGGLWFHLTGTRFYEAVADAELDQLRDVWELESVAETRAVYRGEYLAYRFVEGLAAQGEEALKAWVTDTEQAGLVAVQRFMAERFHEGYTKGVHDHDALLLARALAKMRSELGRLRHAPLVRGLALMCWRAWEEGDDKQTVAVRMMSKGRMRAFFGGGTEALDERLRAMVKEQCRGVAQALGVDDSLEQQVAACLAEELQQLSAKHPALPVTRSLAAAELVRQFRKELTVKRAAADFDATLASLEKRPWLAFEIALEWLRGLHGEVDAGVLVEAAALVVLKDEPPLQPPAEPSSQLRIQGLTGAHPQIDQGGLMLDFHEFTLRLARHVTQVVPRYELFIKRKHEVLAKRRAELRLEEFKAGMLSSFVRNRLIDQVYLPIIGANLAKQLGAVGAESRTDRMGMLLLISPPGYGKTTLMEYVANRLGITLVKINGPAIGHLVTSLDPAEAPNLSARQEIEKLNLSLEMGDNVMIYLDDIQHCNPEFLQKFIPLCDGQRRIEGVFRGVARTYDLRGRKVAVVMAGNPYTEVGGKFQVPDMLANRADTYNLGDILGGHEEAFKDSYIENCLTSNRALSRIAARSHKDVLTALKVAVTGSREDVEFEANHGADEMQEAIEVLERLLKVREVILRVNQEYIRSAATEDAYRTEPPFKLQGSYRNMNRIAEKVQALMTMAEVDGLIEDHYRGESQTLSQAAEANLLKWREITGRLNAEDAARWEGIRKTFGRNLLTGGAGQDDPMGRITGQLNAFNVGLERIGDAVARPTLSEVTMERLASIIEGLRAVPVNVEIKVMPVEESHAESRNPKPEGELPVVVESRVEQLGAKVSQAEGG